MAQTSIHFQAVKGGSEEHNKREKQLDYVHKELSNKNEYWESDTQANRRAFLEEFVKSKTGRKMQAKATPIREAVVVINDSTTMDDLKQLSAKLHDRFKIEIFQIAIHKDEGYKKSNDGIKLNLHAHLVADWTDHVTGKSLKLNRNDMSEMQTICANVLNMQRGKSSEKQHLSAIQYKIAAEERRAAEKAAEAQSYADVVDAARSDIRGLTERKNALDDEILMRSKERDKAQKEAAEAIAKKQAAEKAAVSGLVVGGTKKLANVLGFGAEAKQLKQLEQKIAEAKAEAVRDTKREIFKATGFEVDSLEALDKLSPSELGRNFKYIYEDAKKYTNDDSKKLKIISNMAAENYTYDAAAKLIKDKYADMRYSYEKDLNSFAGNDKAFDFKNKVFDKLCEAQGAHNVSTTENAVGRRKICADGIVCACIRFFDSLSLDRIANSLKAMSSDFNLTSWRKQQEAASQSVQRQQERERDQSQAQSRGWHL